MDIQSQQTQDITETQEHKLLKSLVVSLSTAIDERSPYNANHTRNMIKYATRFMDWLDTHDTPIKFDAETEEELKMAIWLHDVGKLSVPLEIMDKSTRLAGNLKEIEYKMKEMKTLLELDFYKGVKTRKEADDEIKNLNNILDKIYELNTKGKLTDEDVEYIDRLKDIIYVDINGKKQELLTDEDYKYLSIRYGTLTQYEREIMQGHVLSTGVILSKVEFPKNMKDVPKWASSHHELLDGSGYPVGKSGEQIPIQVRFITLMDIFEALTASDRPYKSPMSKEKAFEILDDMAEHNKIDKTLLSLFKDSNVWDDK